MIDIGITNHVGKKHRLEAIIFDLDDTLISWEKSQTSWQSIVEKASAAIPNYLHDNEIISVSDETYLGAFEHVMRSEWYEAQKTGKGVSLAGVLVHTLIHLGIDSDTVDIQALMQLFDWQPGDGVQLLPNAHHVLDQLRERGLKIGLITNAWQPMWMRDHELKKFDLIDRLDARITSGDTGYIKPHPAIFWRMMGMLHTTPERAIMVGDSPTADIRGGNFVGMTTVQIMSAYLDRKQHDVVPDHTITDLSQLLPLVDTLLSI